MQTQAGVGRWPHSTSWGMKPEVQRQSLSSCEWVTPLWVPHSCQRSRLGSSASSWASRPELKQKAKPTVRFKPASKKPLEPGAAAQTSDPNTVKAEAGGLRVLSKLS